MVLCSQTGSFHPGTRVNTRWRALITHLFTSADSLILRRVRGRQWGIDQFTSHFHRLSLVSTSNATQFDGLIQHS